MYLESLTIKNYRKFHSSHNTVCFVEPETIEFDAEEIKASSVISPSTTLIIGKNNAGKTTIANALKMLCNNEQPSASDFNLTYLSELFNLYKLAFEADKETNFSDLDTPSIEFCLSIKVNFNDQDLMAYLAPFIPISEDGIDGPVSINIQVRVELAEEPKFKEEVSQIFREADSEEKEKQRFEKFYSLLSKETSSVSKEGNLYQTSFIDCLGDDAEKFSLKRLINIKEIKANRHLKEGVLSDVFNKIVAFQLTNDDSSRVALEHNIDAINDLITGNVSPKSSDISTVLGQVESSNKVDLNLAGNVTYDDIVKRLIKYNFMDGEDYIPEDQFGLGYINLLNIIGEIIHFVDSYEEKSHFSRINLLFIEEPEAFMHPQMQEFFIKRIDDAVKKALEIANASSEISKTLQCQIAITTHSSHIVNSKIHSSNTFNNLNYLTSIDKCTKSINLTDDSIVSSVEDDNGKILNFIKKHIKYKVSELFFSDAIIFVEGITEETLLNYFLEIHPKLSKHYISVFNINGAHGKLYLPLAKKLSIPSLIVTDLDIKRAKCEKGEKHKNTESCNVCGQIEKSDGVDCVRGSSPSFVQVTSLDGRKTTNTTLKELNKRLREKSDIEADKLDDIDYFEDENLYVVFQKDSIESQHASSLEEALILTNYDNDLINNVIKECKPKIYSSIISAGQTSPETRSNLITSSYKLQKKLSDSKSDFSNKLIFGLLSLDEGDVQPSLPNYLEHGLKWLEAKLELNDISVAPIEDNESSDNIALQEEV
ncbi:Predicted ATP-dependent endonuclease of the OLD family, contains P-loop ATPase and TOPRIM domains [Vibrio chagasii]|nr:Predicted ATP-dependent endonuclease of the OLD family, contains P-loop ATPase and TOPRIM domains [Vibrio chagasii]CAH7127680.1 Predicted ATP-dependent endonuclease of the OLD family, contains P-loop ATPase and TOPRIM domains [Vibrio chagasii]CAH7150442.1 Predicted ATP-dependent endonuclease of the OLD family, contains P-loop ATPase and TOPRIM domains [Vibrio chagasii]CAH7167340.1 Predicted ATP-dependent endonuclease of the OLD family, contains P-loop ATPase and TOPRIM domains [Vibrio chagasi